jgi:hypothetical protein
MAAFSGVFTVVFWRLKQHQIFFLEHFSLLNVHDIMLTQ